MTVTLGRFAKPIRFSRLLLGQLTLSALLLLACPPLATVATAEEKAKAAPKPARTARSSQVRQALDNLFVPPRSSAPKSTASSATRNAAKCAPDQADIEAMSPPQGYGLTLSDRPAIVLNLPQTQAQQVAFTLRSESGDWFESAFLPIPPWPAEPWPSSPLAPAQSLQAAPEARQVSFQLPESSQPLTPGQRYRWSIVVVCGASVEPDDPTFMGWVEYRPPTTSERQVLTGLSSEEKLRWYGERGYWYDMLQP